MKFDNLKEGLELIEKAQTLFQKGPLPFYMTQLVGAYEYLLDRFSPFKVGDRVMLIEELDFGKVPGWKASAHFLVPGAKGTVQNVDCGPKGFSIEVVFYGESFKDANGDFIPIENKHTFTFSESSLVKLA